MLLMGINLGNSGSIRTAITRVLCAGDCCLAFERTELSDRIPEVLLKRQVAECPLGPKQPASGLAESKSM